MRVQHSEGTVTVGADAWVRFRAPAKIGVLVKQLRKALDALLTAKIDNPNLDISNRYGVACSAAVENAPHSLRE